MNAPDYRTIRPKDGDTLPVFAEYRYKDRQKNMDSFCLCGTSVATAVAEWEFRVDFNQLTPEEKEKWFPEATPDYDAMTWAKWNQMTNADKLAFNMPAFEAWGRNEKIEYLIENGKWINTENCDTRYPHRPKPKPTVSSIWVKEYPGQGVAVSVNPQEGYTEYRRVTA